MEEVEEEEGQNQKKLLQAKIITMMTTSKRGMRMKAR